MVLKYVSKYIIISCLSVILWSCNSDSKKDIDDFVGQLELLSSEHTGIDFNNAIKESDKLNHLIYSQIYNGAGVAIGDINNDGLADVFFCGNMVQDKLYLNKGDFKFEDITTASKISSHPGWSWGVTMADINADGYLDIYVSRNGDSMNPEDRINRLYINNKDLTFTESALFYGLGDPGFSTQAVFFDMDNDNDLDMYQVNQPPDPKLFARFKIPQERQRLHTDKLYENVNGRFRDVSSKAGVSGILAHGLSINASDLNNDGWLDLYITNDYDEPDIMYYNNGDGTFRNVINQNLKHISKFSMGSDTGDINNDGYIDLMTLDMAAEDHFRSKTNMGSMSSENFDLLVEWGKHHQYMFNTLQLNSGKNSFYDVAHMAGVAKTDWSWSSLIVDIDNDGLKDILVTNGIKKDFRNNDFLINAYKQLNEGSTDIYELSQEAPSSPLSNYAYRNKGELKFENVSERWGFDTPSFSSGIAYGDLDNDGDLDLIVNNTENEAFVYKNHSNNNYLKLQFKGPDKNPFGFGARVVVSTNGSTQTLEHSVTRGYFSSVEPGLIFGLGKDENIDKVEIIWNDGKRSVFIDVKANSVLIADYSKSSHSERETDLTEPLFTEISAEELGVSFIHEENDFNDFEREILLPHKLSQNGPFSEVADVNNDGREDIFIGGAAQQSAVLYLQNNNGAFTMAKSQPWNRDKSSEDLGCTFADIDNDGDLDLYVASGGSEFEVGSPEFQDRLYVNIGNGNFKKAINALPKINTSSQCVKASDIDKDGDIDFFIGTRLVPGQYIYPASSYILLNNNGIFTDASSKIAPDLENVGMVSDAEFTDIDLDGDEDLLLVGEWMQITLLENENGSFKENSSIWGLDDTRGLWWSITASDLDNDGDDDYIIGNLGLNNKFKASDSHPFKVYANDFDNNGTNDIVLAKYYKDDYVPLRGRECSSQQMPFISEKFKDYNSFASAKLAEILPEQELNSAISYEVSNFESIILINQGDRLERLTMPVQTQVSPIKSILVDDFNKDGNKDIMIVGNHYPAEVETVRYDAGLGNILLGDGNNNFKVMPTPKSGFHVPSDSRDISLIKVGDSNYVLITNNNDKPSVFTF